jgi:hypothetical protein
MTVALLMLVEVNRVANRWLMKEIPAGTKLKKEGDTLQSY